MRRSNAGFTEGRSWRGWAVACKRDDASRVVRSMHYCTGCCASCYCRASSICDCRRSNTRAVSAHWPSIIAQSVGFTMAPVHMAQQALQAAKAHSSDQPGVYSLSARESTVARRAAASTTTSPALPAAAGGARCLLCVWSFFTTLVLQHASQHSSHTQQKAALLFPVPHPLAPAAARPQARLVPAHGYLACVAVRLVLLIVHRVAAFTALT